MKSLSADFFQMLFRQIKNSLRSYSWQSSLRKIELDLNNLNITRREKILSLCLSPLSLLVPMLVSVLIIFFSSQLIFSFSKPIAQTLEQANLTMIFVGSDFESIFIFAIVGLVSSIIFRIEAVYFLFVFLLLQLQQISFAAALSLLAGVLLARSLFNLILKRNHPDWRLYFSIFSLALPFGLVLSLLMRGFLNIQYDFQFNSYANAQNFIFLFFMMFTPSFLATMVWGHFTSQLEEK